MIEEAGMLTTLPVADMAIRTSLPARSGSIAETDPVSR